MPRSNPQEPDPLRSTVTARRSGGLAHRVLIAGYYGYGNAGDEAILSCLVKDLRQRRSDLDLVVATGDPAGTRRAHGVRTVHRDNLPGIIELAAASDLVVLGGGGLFQDYWESRSEDFLTREQTALHYYASFPAIAAMTRTPCMIYAAGVGPLETDDGREKTRQACDLCHCVTVRDPESRDLLSEIGVEDPARIEVTADPAFGLQPAPPEDVDRRLQQLDVDPASLCVAVSLRSWEQARNGWEDEVAQGLDHFLDDHDGMALLVPFQQASSQRDDDRRVLLEVAGRMRHKARTRLLEGVFEAELLAAAMGRCRLALTMRYHAALFALQAARPVVALAYDPKVSRLMAQAGVPEAALTAESWRSERITKALEEASRRPEATSPGPLRHLPEAAGRTAALALRSLEENPLPPVADAHRRFLATLARTKTHEVVALRAELGRQRRYSQEFRNRADRLDHTATTLAREKDHLEREKALLETELSTLHRSLGVRCVLALWAFLRHVLPAGSLRWRLYRALRGLPYRDSEEGALPPEAPVCAGESSRPSQGNAPSGEDLPSPDPIDPWQGLAELERQARERGESGVALFLSGTRFAPDEGQRPYQLARELAGRGIPVVFAYHRWQDDGSPRLHLDGRVLELPGDCLLAAPMRLASCFDGRRLVIFEYPNPAFMEILSVLNSQGWISLYDVLDDWQGFSDVGQAQWYDAGFERHMITSVDAVLAVSEPLRRRVAELGGEEVELLPNGVDLAIARVSTPRDLVRGDITVGYFGYLSPSWFDWELVAAAAEGRPSWRFYVIGYGGSPERAMPGNVVLVGAVAQAELAGYAASWDVAVVPFKTGSVAESADPIKVYEYLAMGLPVVTTGVPVPVGGDRFVLRAQGVEDFLSAVEHLAGRTEETAPRRTFAAQCSWSRRIDALFDLLTSQGQRIGEKLELFKGLP